MWPLSLQVGELGWLEWYPHCCSRDRAECFHDSPACCPVGDVCGLWGDRWGCQSPLGTCMVTGDPHHFTFCGAAVHFRSTCTYHLVHPGGPRPFPGASPSVRMLPTAATAARVCPSSLHRGGGAQQPGTEDARGPEGLQVQMRGQKASPLSSVQAAPYSCPHPVKPMLHPSIHLSTHSLILPTLYLFIPPCLS